MAQEVKNLPGMQETQVWSLGWIDLLEKGMATHSSVLAWRIPWTEETVGYSPWGCKEADTTEWLTLSLFTVRMSSCQRTDRIQSTILKIYCERNILTGSM